MEIRELAERILLAESLDEKLAFPAGELTDESPGRSLRPRWPARPRELQVGPTSRGVKMPKSVSESRLRAVAHHIMANHELQALEVMAFVLLAFPNAPQAFRQEITTIIRDEQRHTRMHMARCDQLGVRFGELPVNGYVWKKACSVQTLLEYLAFLPLTLEGGNLDHSLYFSSQFASAGDIKSAQVMQVIHHDEIEHVSFGLTWLRKLKDPGQSDWDVYLKNLVRPLKPHDAVGQTMDLASRKKAGLDELFLTELARAAGKAHSATP